MIEMFGGVKTLGMAGLWPWPPDAIAPGIELALIARPRSAHEQQLVHKARHGGTTKCVPTQARRCLVTIDAC